jgi:hypothetical protein
MDPSPGGPPPESTDYPRDAQAIQNWGRELRPEEAVVPVLYHFRATHYVKVAPERLREWEEYFVENVGLTPDVTDSPARLDLAHRSATLSGSHQGWDDADYV